MEQVEARPGRCELAPAHGEGVQPGCGNEGERARLQEITQRAASVAVCGLCARARLSPQSQCPAGKWGGCWPTTSRAMPTSQGQCKSPGSPGASLSVKPMAERAFLLCSERAWPEGGLMLGACWVVAGVWPESVAGGAVGTEGRARLRLQGLQQMRRAERRTGERRHSG